jgi:hypothetical protein
MNLIVKEIKVHTGFKDPNFNIRPCLELKHNELIIIENWHKTKYRSSL